MPTILEYVAEFTDILPTLISAGIDVSSLFSSTSKAIKKMQAESRDPTGIEWDAMNKIIDDLRDQLPDVE